MNIRNYEDINKINTKLLTILVDQYPNPESLYVRVAGLDLDYDLGDEKDGPLATFKIIFGSYDPEGNPDDNWQKVVMLPFVFDDLNFIAGQFFQILNDKEL